jgi:hypothetical protein
MPIPNRASRCSPVTQTVSGFQKQGIRIAHGNTQMIWNQAPPTANMQDRHTINSVVKPSHQDVSVLR